MYPRTCRPMIEVSNLSKSFVDGTSSKTVLKDISFSLPSDTSVSITGESGSGKSTFLHLLATLVQPDSGAISVNGELITAFSETESDAFRKATIGIVFQHFNLIESLNVLDNIYLPARLTKNVDHGYINALIEQLGVGSLTHKLPAYLSGGEQQRVAIARALAHKPQLVLADEPTGNLDDKNSQRVANLLFESCRDNNTGLILVTHSEQIASQAAHHLHLHEGRFDVNR